MWWQQLKATNYLEIFLFFWLALLSYYLIRTINHYRRLTRGAAGQSLSKILEDVTQRQRLEEKQLVKHSEEIAKQKGYQVNNFHKFAFIRFNPFEDTGGDQSFAIALLDGKNDGVVVSSLHSRGGTRVYAKEVVGAKPTTHPFSKEEKEVVAKACQRKIADI